LKKNTIARAWVDQAFRSTLSPEELAAMPDHPAGVVNLGEDELTQTVGGVSANWYDGCRSMMSCSALFSDCGSGGGNYCY
jgi:mersacidin/lichenicidin family type 2 lantibiotic